MVTATIFEAKNNLSDLVEKARAGETVFITSGDDAVPVARLEAIRPLGKKRLGGLEMPGSALPDDFFDPLPEEYLGES